MLPFPNWIQQEIVEELHTRKIHGFFDWQADVLSDCSLRQPSFGNLLYSAPTSSGKTLVAELLAINNVLSTGRKALFVFPYISVAREKFVSLQKVVRRLNLRIQAYVGSSSAPIDCWDIAVCTIEKANSLLNKAIDEDFIKSIGSIVIDEFHMLFDNNRGLLIEQMISKVIYLCKRKIHEVQVIGMSATFSNLMELGKWLNAKCYTTKFRPVVLNEMILSNNELIDASSNQSLRFIGNGSENEMELLTQLCLESLQKKMSVLVFCSSKVESEKVANSICESLIPVIESSKGNNVGLKESVLKEAVDYFIAETHCHDEAILKLVGAGVCFHHAGLTIEERELLEDFFRAGILRIICATSTLSSGVNLPADRVIIKAQYYGNFLTNTTYNQMVGRAGRFGRSSTGFF
uniref:DNA-directed DNA polymerase n=1 Tax=Syphacia muris TaxID=451379 RepID=A0A0N5AQE1_9BILA